MRYLSIIKIDDLLRKRRRRRGRRRGRKRKKRRWTTRIFMLMKMMRRIRVPLTILYGGGVTDGLIKAMSFITG